MSDLPSSSRLTSNKRSLSVKYACKYCHIPIKLPNVLQFLSILHVDTSTLPPLMVCPLATLHWHYNHHRTSLLQEACIIVQGKGCLKHFFDIMILLTKLVLLLYLIMHDHLCCQLLHNNKLNGIFGCLCLQLIICYTCTKFKQVS